MELNFTGKRVLVTGATRGIGKAIADDFYNAGADLILTGTNPDTIARLNEDIKREGIQRKHYLQADFSCDESMKSFLTQLAQYETIDVCVNNAGINRIDKLDETKVEDFDLIMQVNLKSAFLICRQVGGMMKRAGYGRIVNIASIWSIVTRPGRSLYTTSKFGLDGLTRTSAVELAPFNVMVNTVSPGFTMTELTRTTNTPEEIRQISEKIPAQRMAQPEEIAKIVLFLAGDLNTYITGQNIAVDGGYTNV
ncbi:MAG: SDR family oxidoreductase [bacterium]|nr:SDR family oxidoreductase [bacterium]